MLRAKTLIHKAAMPIAVHAVRTFAAVSGGQYSLEIHSDGSLTQMDFEELERVGRGLAITRIEPGERDVILAPKVAAFPRCKNLFLRGGYMTKMAGLARKYGPFFYFDSDIVWLKPFCLTAIEGAEAVFSTETWSWYYGMRHPARWIARRVPRRINSGFALHSGPFPFDRLEEGLAEGLFDADHPWATDQELLALLYPRCRIFSMSDFDRSRRGITYDLERLNAVALHFPGRMWKPHLAAVAAFQPDTSVSPRQVCNLGTKALGPAEILPMKGVEIIETNPLLARAANAGRRWRAMLRK